MASYAASCAIPDGHGFDNALVWIKRTQDAQRRLVAIMHHCIRCSPRNFARMRTETINAPTADWGYVVARSRHMPIFGKSGASCIRCFHGFAGPFNGPLIRHRLLSPMQTSYASAEPHSTHICFLIRLPLSVPAPSHARRRFG